MSLPRYATYRDSGVSWLGNVPAHWKVLRLKRACIVFPSNVDKHSRDDEAAIRLCNYTDVYYNEQITSDMQFMEATASTDQIARFALKAGDTIITKDSETADDIAIAAYVPDDLPGVVCGYHLSMVRPRPETAGAFVKRLFDSVYAKARFAVAANGLTRVGLGQYVLDNVELPFPPFVEQAAIAAFLDRETAKIDALIAEKERLTALLAEKRQATISHFVTCGLNPNALMADSGVTWVGIVPAHWHVQRLKTISPEITVGIVVEPSKYYVDEGVPALRSLNISAGRITTENLVYISPESNEALAKSRLHVGDLVSVRSGQTGVTSVVPSEMDGCNCIDLIIIRKPSQHCEQFLCWFFASDSALRQFASGSGGAIQQHFNIGTAMNLQVPLPPIEEQRAIADFLERETAKLDALSAEAERAVNLLKERRSALIAAAVSGQIDVRSAKPQPAQLDEVAANRARTPHRLARDPQGAT